MIGLKISSLSHPIRCKIKINHTCHTLSPALCATLINAIGPNYFFFNTQLRGGQYGGGGYPILQEKLANTEILHRKSMKY